MNSELRKLEKEKQIAASNSRWKEAADKCNFIGSELSRLGKHDEALKFHNEELTYNDMIGDRLGVAIANRRIGECYSQMNNFAKALSHIETFKKISIELSDIVEEQRAWATLGRTFYLKYLTDQEPSALDKAEMSYVKALELTKELKLKVSEKELAEMKARCLLNLGLVSEYRGNMKECGKCIEKAICLARKFGLHEDLNRCQSSLASVFQKHGQYAEALRLLEGAIASAKKLRDKTLLCDELSSKALILVLTKDFEGAKQCLKEAYRKRSPIKEDHERISKMLKICVGLCQLQSKLQEIDPSDSLERKVNLEKIADGLSSLECYKLAIEFYFLTLQCMEEGDFTPAQKAPIYYSIALTYKDMGEHDKALKYLNEEMICNEENPSEQVKSLWKMAEVFEEQQNFPESERTFLEALSLAQKLGNKKHQVRALAKLLGFYEQNHMVDKASAIEDKLKDSEFDDVSSEESDNEDSQDLFENIRLSEISAAEDSDAAHRVTSRPKRQPKKIPKKINPEGETMLHKACIRGDFATVKRLVENGDDVNISDNNGWTPLHEASNHGHLDIVEYLLDHGAKINERGGQKRQFITPLHDAAENMHLDVMQLLLSRGASATILDFHKNTPLDALLKAKAYNRSKMNEYELEHCKRVEEELRTRMRNAGVVPKYSEDFDFDNQFDEPIGRSSQNQASSENSWQSILRLSEQDSIDADSHQEQGTAKRSRQTSSSSSEHDSDATENIENFNSQPRNEANGHSDWDTISEAQSEYKSVMCNLRRSAQSVLAQPKVVAKKPDPLPDLLDENEIVKDWLIMDTKQPAKMQRKRRKVSRLNVRTSKSLYNYLETKDKSEISPCKEKEVCITEENSNDASQSVSTANHLPCLQKPENNVNNFSALMKNDSYKPPFCLKVWIRDELLHVPVPEDSCSIEWLAEEAARRYQEKHLSRPQLTSFMTLDGGCLSNKDIIKSTLVNNTELKSTIAKWDEPTLEERYVHLCMIQKIEPTPSVQTELLKFNISNEIDLSNSPIDPQHVDLIFEALSYFKTLGQLHLNGVIITSFNIQTIISCFPTFVSLMTLNMNCCALFTDSLRQIAEYLDSQTNPENCFPRLKTLNLSNNLFCQPCNSYIRSLLQISSLTTLNLSHSDLYPMVFEDLSLCQTLERCKNLQIFDISGNPLSDISLRNLLNHLPKDNLIKLNLNETAEDCPNFGEILKNFIFSELSHLTEVSLERCNLTDQDLFLFTIPTFLNSLPELKSINLSANPKLSSNAIINFLKVALNNEQPLEVHLAGTCVWNWISIEELINQVDFKCLSSMILETDVGRGQLFDCWKCCWGDRSICFDSVFCKLCLS